MIFILDNVILDVSTPEIKFMARPTTTELIEGLEGLNTKKEVEAYIRESLIQDGKAVVNKNHCTQYNKAIREQVDASLLPSELQYLIKSRGNQYLNHYAVKIISDIQRDLTEGTKPTAQQKAVKAQQFGNYPINIASIVKAAREGLKSSQWRLKLVSLCLLTGRRIGAIAYEASFEPRGRALMLVTSGQKKRGKTSSVLIPVLDDPLLIAEAIEEVREQVRLTHKKPYERWLAEPSPENGQSLSNTLTGSSAIKKAFDEFLKPLFGNHPMSRKHDLRGLYGAIIAKCHEAITSSANPSHFVQMILDHESVGTTQDYLKFTVLGTEEVLESMSEDFVKAMDAKTYEIVSKKYFPFDLDAFLSAISNENAKTEIASLLDGDMDSFAANLGTTLNRLYTVAQAFKPAETSATARIENVIRAIMDYNISQEGSPDPAFVRITVPLINSVGKLVGDKKTFDSKTMKNTLERMATEVEKHHDDFSIQENQNLYYRRGNKMEEIIQNIASQHG